MHPHTSTQVAALYVRKDSVYLNLPHVDAWTQDRDARLYTGPFPVVAHPPCGQWGRLRTFARRDEAEKALGPLAVEQVRQFGGVLEHPANSTLWKNCGLPHPSDTAPGAEGWTLDIDQLWWGHPCRKRTWLFIVGCDRRTIPPIHFPMRPPTHVIGKNRGKGLLPELSKAGRERTTPHFAAWLIALASRCKPEARSARQLELAGRQAALAAGQSPAGVAGDAR